MLTFDVLKKLVKEAEIEEKQMKEHQINSAAKDLVREVINQAENEENQTNLAAKDLVCQKVIDLINSSSGLTASYQENIA